MASSKLRRILVPRPAWSRELDEAMACATSERREDSAAMFDWLSTEVLVRRDFWWGRGRRPAGSLVWVVFWLALASTLATIGSVTVSGSFGVLGCCWVPITVMISLGLWIATFTLMITDTEHNRRVTADGRACPECGYNLLGVPPAIPPSLLRGVSTGPRSCPECGLAWPCVPPPIREHG